MMVGGLIAGVVGGLVVHNADAGMQKKISNNIELMGPIFFPSPPFCNINQTLLFSNSSFSSSFYF